MPARTSAQRHAALDKAKLLRHQRTELLAAVKNGVVTLPGVLEQADADPDGPAARTRVRLVLSSLPGFGPVTAQRLMDEVGISASRRVRGLGVRQRNLLVAAVEWA
ncbi:integration host factor, actinobacterial type [Amycolatopsis sp. FDAARGOS 1241]|uniref:integration host factor, actinobacterial type n=1 Tax=Amycolatopsis sp. FDAARGOS 1241 TaxID=2778070 RepID=UPI001950B233|nr:integration host factor, actinobacterial type [Amycolatopsis sp. FDAARGOS 1241]QRP49602.1 integration host factor [Amycolatopsis sp. FDAARGOS 1241]